MLTKSRIYEKITPEIIEEYGFTIEGLAMFLAQCDHETLGFTYMVERFMYSKERLLEVFPKYFNQGNIKKYFGKPEMIANRIYANRMGNGDEASGDGYKYRGRGWIQLTGRHNYELYAKTTYWNILDFPQVMNSPSTSLNLGSALWFFKHNGIINNTNCVEVTKKINGGYNGVLQRGLLYDAYLKVLK